MCQSCSLSPWGAASTLFCLVVLPCVFGHSCSLCRSIRPPWPLPTTPHLTPASPHPPAAGLSARMLPVWLHAAEEGRRLRASDAEFERVVSLGVGPLDTGTEEQEVRGGGGLGLG